MRERLGELMLMPVIEIPDAGLAVPLADALIAGGLPAIEITFRTPAAAASIAAIAGARPEVLVGAGTVRSAEQVDVAMDSGARFLVSPGVSPGVVGYARERGMPILPGVCTPTEIEMAHDLGIELVKFFPAGPSGGPGYLKALTGPYGSVGFVPTGGITSQTLPDYLAIGQVVAVGGSWMAPSELIADGDFGGITVLVAEAVAAARRSRATAGGEG